MDLLKERVDMIYSHRNEQFEKLVKEHHWLVRKYAFRYRVTHDMTDDLIQIGLIGLLLAYQRYNSERGVSFESFAMATISGEMKRYLRDQTWSVHVPRRMKELGPRIKKTFQHLTATLNRPPTDLEIARFLDVSVKEIVNAKKAWQAYQAISLYKKVSKEDGEHELYDFISVEDKGIDDINESLYINEMLRILTKNEEQVILLTVMDGYSQMQAATRLGLSQMQVSRIRKKALEKLRSVVAS